MNQHAPPVRNGIDNISGHLPHFRGRHAGLVTGPTGLDSRFHTTADILSTHCHLKALFSPEHGLYGETQAGEAIASTYDERTGLPVYSLYGQNREPTQDMVKGLDLMVFDMQDVGVRWYTYLYTMTRLMRFCARQKLPLTILDRVNPLGGNRVSGNVLDPLFASFVGEYPIPVRHGFTIGEFARWVNQRETDPCELHVIPCEGWHRSMSFQETDLPWINPSPNLPTHDSLLCYEGTCLFEGTNLSEGRGTTKPFEFVGAPFLDGWQLAGEMNALKLPGVRFRTVFFTPTFSKHAGKVCAGVQLHITEREAFDGFRTGLHLLFLIRQMNPAFSFLENKPGKWFIDLLAGTDELRRSDFTPDAFIQKGRAKVDAFRTERMDFLLYD